MTTTYIGKLEITYTCPKCKKEAVAEFDRANLDCNLMFNTDSCDVCGSHGYVEIDCQCKCGHSTTVTLGEK